MPNNTNSVLIEGLPTLVPFFCDPTHEQLKFDSKCLDAPETEKVTFDEKGRHSEFDKEFMCLGSTIECLIDETAGIR